MTIAMNDSRSMNRPYIALFATMEYWDLDRSNDTSIVANEAVYGHGLAR